MVNGVHERRHRDLVDVLVSERKRLGLHQKAIADHMGWPIQLVSRYENYERRLDAVEFADIARFLGMDLASLIVSIPERV